MKYEFYRQLNSEQKEEVNYEVIEPSKQMIYAMLATYVIMGLSNDKATLISAFMGGLWFYGWLFYYSHFKAKKLLKKFGVDYK